MTQHYDLEWLIEKFHNGDTLEYLFFWGHSKKPDNTINKSCLSQWFELPFTIDDVIYRTAEHWMMAQKALLFSDKISFLKIIESNTPKEAKEIGRYVVDFDEQVWNKKKYDIVITGNIHKFNQHPEYASYLLSTKDQILVEASPVDTIWGIGLNESEAGNDNPYDWKGLNLLGFALMEVRDFLDNFGHFSPLEDVAPMPWDINPDSDPADMYWRMGTGEDLIRIFSEYYDKLTPRERTILRLTKPEPPGWNSFYSEF